MILCAFLARNHSTGLTRRNLPLQWHVGRFYYRGSRHIPRDWTRAARYLRKAASSLSSLPLRSDLTPSEKADVKAAADAAALLGQMYVRGEGVARSNRTAFDYFRRAMNAGGSMGAVGLAKMYMHGNDVVAKVLAAVMGIVAKTLI